MVQQLSTNTFGTAKWIVSSDATQGTHTTIAGALTSASSGDTIAIRPGTYTENLTLKAGVNLVAYTADAYTPNVIINGKCTATFVGTASLSGIYFQTNSDFCLAVTGSSATVINLENCFISALNNTAISFTSSSSSAVINIFYCNGDLGTTGIAYFSHSSNGTLRFNGGVYNNGSSSTTNCTCSAGNLYMDYLTFNSPITVSGTTSTLQSEYIKLFGGNLNTTMLTNTTTNANPSTLYNSEIASGSASCISIGAGSTLVLTHTVLDSTNTNVLTGSGTLKYSYLTFVNTSSGSNVSTQVALSTLPSSSGGSGLVLLNTQTASSSASIVFNNTLITSTYKNYVITWDNVTAANTSNTLELQISSDNGSTYKTTGYSGVGFLANSGANAGESVTTYIGLSSASVFSSTNQGSGIANLFNLTAGTFPMWNNMCGLPQSNNSNNPSVYNAFGWYGTNITVNNIKIFFASGNIAAGNFHLYGVAT